MCLDNRFMQLRGVAARRGEIWGAQMTVHWPDETMRALAEARVADLTRDRRLLAKLAAEAVTWAEKARAGGGSSPDAHGSAQRAR